MELRNWLVAILCLIISFLSTYFLTTYWIFIAKKRNFLSDDMNKYGKPKVVEPGFTLIFGFAFSILVFIFLKTFLLNSKGENILIFALLLTAMLAAFIGFIDDILRVLGGLNIWQKLLFTIPIALPLMVVDSGRSIIHLPIIGNINLGLAYLLIITPLGVIGSVNGFNILAGYNGLETGMGIIILGTLGSISFINGNSGLSLISFCAVSALVAFLIFNWCPAKIIPGDSVTYFIGALIATIAILGNIEKLTLLLFLPYFLDAALLVRARTTKVAAFAKPNPDNSLELPYDKCYDSTHIALKILKQFRRKVYESDVVKFILFIEVILSLVGLYIFVI